MTDHTSGTARHCKLNSTLVRTTTSINIKQNTRYHATTAAAVRFHGGVEMKHGGMGVPAASLRSLMQLGGVSYHTR